MRNDDKPPKPVPIPDEESMPFFDGAKRHDLMLLQCRGCGTYMWPGAPFASSIRRRCISCFGNNLAWAKSSGKGTLYTFGVMHQVYDPGFADDVPYNVAIVELREGPRMTTNVVGCSNDELEIGMALEVCFESLEDGLVIPKFRPVGVVS